MRLFNVPSAKLSEHVVKHLRHSLALDFIYSGHVQQTSVLSNFFEIIVSLQVEELVSCVLGNKINFVSTGFETKLAYMLQLHS